MTFDEIYFKLLNKALNQEKSLNMRTTEDIKAYFGESFRWDMNYYPVLTCRQTYIQTAAAEVAWMLLGDKDISFLQKYSKIWDKFVNEYNQMETAYGYRWKHEFGVNQIQNIITKLKKDPSSRQQVLMAWDPYSDNIKPAKNIPCPYSCVINIINNKLNIFVTLRSNDLAIGLPYDILTYTLLGNLFANELNVEVGEVYYTIAHAHLYLTHEEAIKEVLNNPIENKKYKINCNLSIKELLNNPDNYIVQIYKDLKSQNYKDNLPKYKLEVIE